MFNRKPDISRMRKKGNVRGLIKALKHKAPMIKYGAAEALGGTGDKRSLKPLIESLGDDDNIMRAHAADALGKLGDPIAVEPLAILLKTKKQTNNPYQRDARESAANALGKLGKPATDALISALTYPDPDVYFWSLRALEGCDDPRLLDIIIDTFKNPDYKIRRIGTAFVHKTSSSRIMPYLMSLLGDKVDAVRKEADSALKRMYPQWTTAFFLLYIEDPDPNRRSFAVDALRQLKDPAAIEPLLSVLKKSPSIHIIDALGEIGGSQVVSELVPFVKDKIVGLRFAAVKMLKKIGGDSVVPALVSAIDDPDESIVKLAIAGLGASGSSKAAAPLLDMLQKEKLTHRREKIVDALAELYKSQTVAETDKLRILALKNELDAKHNDNPYTVHDDRFDESGPAPNDCSHTDEKIHSDSGQRINLNM